MDVYENIKRLGIALPPPDVDTDCYRCVRRMAERVYFVSGNGCTAPKGTICGQIPSRVSMEQGEQAARQALLNLISTLEASIGDLNRVESFVKLLVFVASDPTFSQQHLIANAASRVLIDIFGDEVGRSARSAIGVAALPDDCAVEIEAVVQLRPETGEVLG